MEPNEFVVDELFGVEAIDVDSPNYITVMLLPVMISQLGQKHVKVGDYYFDAYQLQRIVDKLKENK